MISRLTIGPKVVMNGMGNAEWVHVNGVDLCVECLGDPGDPPILLIMGSGASMDWWEDEFCERLVAGRRFVVRYDHRDTGQSVSYEPGAPGYTLDDLIADPAALIDRLDLGDAHVVGISMGGGLAQGVVLAHPDRVGSLTLIATAPAAPGPEDPDLPSMSDETIAQFSIDAPDWSDRGAAIDYMTRLARVSAGRAHPLDEATFRQLAARVFDRTRSMASTMTNHNVLDGGERTRERLGEIDVPTLVVHGTDDPVVPYGNALALVREIRGARLLTLEGTGHDLPRPVWDVVVAAILEQTGGSEVQTR
jgi:pimeloyl-ACP methyl ester carboxylesterase